MLQMGFQEIVGGRQRCRYEKLSGLDDKVSKPGFGRCWVKKTNGRLKGLRLSRSRKITLKVFSVVVLTSKIAKIYSEIVNRMSIDGVCPGIVFTSQWGLPILSHSSVKCRKIAVCLDRKLET
ncbi:hypothetical protein TorRG33x02_244520 [Trema orientale]|uniref:Uncharacterized protein n=1 Tax=Trema orientale TaxID=63057 RepID=A0A2P5DRC9_TREOI|nr:hypothetical protein TorRG33x02_244520 [Trema orientale]